MLVETKVSKVWHGLTDNYRTKLLQMKGRDAFWTELEPVTSQKREISTQLAMAFSEKTKVKHDLEQTLTSKLTLLTQLKTVMKNATCEKQQRETDKRINVTREEISQLQTQLEKYISENSVLEYRSRRLAEKEREDASKQFRRSGGLMAYLGGMYRSRGDIAKLVCENRSDVTLYRSGSMARGEGIVSRSPKFREFINKMTYSQTDSEC